MSEATFTSLYNVKTKKVPCVLISAAFGLDRPVCSIFPSSRWEVSSPPKNNGEWIKLTGTRQQWEDLRDGLIEPII